MTNDTGLPGVQNVEWCIGFHWGRCLGQILALANQKGGVGKTTTSVSLACYLAGRGHRILLIDLDPQGNATSTLGIEKRDLAKTTYDVLVDGVSIESCLIPQVRPNLDLLGANQDLAEAEAKLNRLANGADGVHVERMHYRLRTALIDIRRTYDAVLIDCPPSLGMLTVNALTACDGVLIPVQCEYLALEGLAQMTGTFELVREGLNPSLELFGLLLTMYDPRTKLSAMVVSDVRRMFPNRTFATVIPRSVRLAEAPSYGQSIFEYDDASRGAEAYRQLGAEVETRAGLATSVSTRVDANAVFTSD